MLAYLGSTLTSPQMPETLGRFQIVRRLGQGAQSVVYLAFDPQLHREVAVKSLRGSADTAATLLNEARAVSRLSHAAIIPVFEAAMIDGGAGGAYLVFEYVGGPTLAELLKQQGALEASVAVKTLLPVLDAVAYAHANQVIHRDLKPSNILLDRRGLARVMDFGVAVRQVGVDPAAPAPAGGGMDDEDAGFSSVLVGTPAYMAPEYIQNGTVSPQMDVFSAGLILYEMLTGRRAVPGDVGFQAIHFLVNHDISLPETLPYPVDERLRAIIGRALARDPVLRYARMVDLVQALNGWLEPLPSLPELGGAADTTVSLNAGRIGAAVAATAAAVALEALLRRIRLKSEFPALSESMVLINRLASSDQQNLGVLTEAVLRDSAVTLKLLRMVNSAMYRSFGGGAVTTVSRAIQLLGYAAVRTAATSLPLLDTNKDKAYAGRVLDEVLLSHFCGVVARELSGLRDRDAEEAFVCGGLHRLGQMLVTCYFPDESGEIERLSQGRADQRDRAARQVLGLGYEALGTGVAKHWGLPEMIVRSMRAVVETLTEEDALAGAVTPSVATPGTRTELLRVLSACAAELSGAWMQDTPERRQAGIALASHRYAKALAVTSNEIKAALVTATNAVKALLHTLRQDLHHSEVARRLGLVAARPVTPSAASPTPPPAATPPPHFPGAAATVPMPMRRDTAAKAADQLAQCVQSLASRLLEPFKLNELLLCVLQSVQQAAGFQQVIFCVREVKTHALVGRLSVGATPTGDTNPGRLRIPMDDPSGVFAAAVFKGEDLWLPDLATHALGHQVSDAIRQTLGAGSVLLLPLMLKGQALGLIYADHHEAHGVQLGEKELALLGTVRSQVLLAIRQRSF